MDSNFWKRTATGALFVAVLVGAVLWNEYSFVALCFAISFLALQEYVTLFKGREHRPNPVGTVAGGALFMLLYCYDNLHLEHHVLHPEILDILNKSYWDNSGKLALFALLIPLLAELFLNNKPSLKNLGLSLAGIFYINLGICCFGLLPFTGAFEGWNYHASFALGFLILLWSSDTFAYLTGRAFGKTPLAPKISPKKTWEGSIGGALCTIGVSLLLYKTIGVLQWQVWAGLALVIVVFGTFGDLIESMFKRAMGVKDSGHILPGHGGILDRFDSLLLAAPFSILFLSIMDRLW